MNINVLNKNFEQVDVIDSYESVIWTTRYFTPGDFELMLSVDSEIIENLKEGYYLVREQDALSEDEYHNVMIIENFEITTDAEEGDKLLVKGKCLKSIVGRRVVHQQTILNGRVDVCIKELLNDNIINPSNENRKISNFVVGSHNIINSYELSMQVTGNNLAEVISEICMTYGYGWDMFIKSSIFIFYLYEGVDHSYNQSENPYVIFSSEFDNLLTSDYKSIRDNYANVAIVAGEGEGINRKKVIAGSVKGLDRYEIFVDSRNSSSNDGEITEDEYNNMLLEEGVEELSNRKITTSFEGDVDDNGNFKLKTDYNMGDLVQVENDYGVSAATRIIEIIESEDEAGTNMIATFSDMEGV